MLEAVSKVQGACIWRGSQPLVLQCGLFTCVPSVEEK